MHIPNDLPEMMPQNAISNPSRPASVFMTETDLNQQDPTITDLHTRTAEHDGPRVVEELQ
jgi:hypothetical protein